MTTSMVTDGMYVVAEHVEAGSTYYYRGMNLIGYTSEENIGYYRFNAHGDVVAVADVAGKVITEYEYDPFGKLEDDENEWLKILFGIYVEDNNPFRYCAEYYDTETEFIYLRARYYSPDLQRFISEDPIRDGNNWYAYCGNNPVMLVDPLGNATKPYNWRDLVFSNLSAEPDTENNDILIAKKEISYEDALAKMDAYLNGEKLDIDALNWFAENGTQTTLGQIPDGQNGEDYNRYDNKILGFVNYFNAKFDEEIDANTIKAIIYQESRMGYYNGSESANGQADVMQCLDARNPAIYRLAAINGKWSFSPYEARDYVPSDGYGLFKKAFKNDEYNRKAVTVDMSIAGGILVYLWKGQSVKRYNGGGDPNYTSKIENHLIMMGVRK